MKATSGSAAAVSDEVTTGSPADSSGSRWTAWRGRWRGEPDLATVTVGELAVLLAILGVAVLATVGLAATYAGHFGMGLLAVGTVVVLAVLGVLVRFAGALPRVVLDLPGLLVLAGSGVLAMVMFLPGFHYAAGDSDPGGYMMAGATIAREHSLPFTDPTLLAHVPVSLQSPAARFNGIWVPDPAHGRIMPQFYHLWSVLLAVSAKLHGFAGEANTNPLVGVLAVLLAVAVARRLGGPVAAGAAGLLFSTNMLEVWQAKYPTAEVFTQALYLGAALGVIIALQTRWRWPAGVAGLLVGAGWLARADGLLLVLLSIGVGCTLWVLRRFDARCWWFAAGLAVLFPFGLYQAYGPAKQYTAAAAIPKMPKVLGIVAAVVLLALVLRPVLARTRGRLDLVGWLTRGAQSPTGQRRFGLALVGVCCVLFVLGGLRPQWGPDWTDYNGRTIRSYDEHSLHRLSWFFNWTGLVLIVVGVAFVALRRWTPAPWVVAVPTLIFLPVYLWHSHNSTYLMWWNRRFVPYAVPGMVLLIAVAIGGLWMLRDRLKVPGRVAATGFAAGLAVLFASQSLPLRHHDEWGGSFFVEKDIASLSGGRQGVYLWQRAGYCCAAPTTLFASPLWLEQDQIVELLPKDPAAFGSYVTAYAQHFSDRPVFVVLESGVPPQVPGLRITAVRPYGGTLPKWEQSDIHRPRQAIAVPYRFVVYRVELA